MYTVTDAEGRLEIVTEGVTSFGFVTRNGADRLYVGARQIQCFGLKTGDYIRGKIHAPYTDELFYSFVLIEEVNGKSLQNTN